MDDTGRVISSQAVQEWTEGSTTNAVDSVGTVFMDSEFLMGCALGDGCLSRDKRWGTVTLHVSRCARQEPYARWQLDRLNECLGTRAKLNRFNDKGKYPAVRFGVSSKRALAPVYEVLYPLGKKHFTRQAVQDLGPLALALLWMDDGSLEVRRRQGPRSVKIERSGWLPVSHDSDEVEVVNEWIHGVTGATGSVTRHRTGMLYLRWHARQFRLLVEAIQGYILPCLAYKVDLTRTGNVSEWLSESQTSSEELDDKATRVLRTPLG